MFTNYIRIAVRNLIRHKGFTLINILGLATSMSICLLIILFIMDQNRMDKHILKGHQKYRVITEFQDDEKGRVVGMATSPFGMAELVSFNVNSVADVSQIVKVGGTIKQGDKILAFAGLHASENFLDFFDFELISGNGTTAMSSNHSVLLTSELSEKMFFGLDPMGQIVVINELGSFEVTGVIDSKSYKSHVQFDLILPMSVYKAQTENQLRLTEWELSSKHFYNYVELEKVEDEDALISFLTNIENMMPEAHAHLYSWSIQPIAEVNLGRLVRNEIGVTTPSLVAYFFGVLALVVILSASFNYMNLSIARALKRAKEVGIRKVIGAGRNQIIVQFLVEAQIVMLSALVIAGIILIFLVPVFNELKVLRDIDGAITMDVTTNGMVYVMFLMFSVTIGLVAGIYPALYLSSFKSLTALKGANQTGKSPSFLFRKILIFFQYSFSIIFIITTIILYQQAIIFVNADHGFDHQRIINVPLSHLDYESFRNELTHQSGVTGVSAISSLPVLSDFEERLVVNRNKEAKELKSSYLSIDTHAMENLGLQLVAGRNFQKTQVSDQTESVIITEKLVIEMNIESPDLAINQTIDVIEQTEEGRVIQKRKIIGVVKDFKYQFIFQESGPLLIAYAKGDLKMMNIKYEEGKEKQVLAAVETAWRKFDQTNPFEYKLYDYQISDMDEEFGELVQIIGLISFMAILIACLGQFSMVVHHVQLKVKEIGVRKVLGASMPRLMFILSKDFLVVILASIFLATPLAWKINILWTNKLYLSPEVSWLNLSMGLSVIVILAVGTIFYLVRKAAEANPIDSLKYE